MTAGFERLQELLVLTGEPVATGTPEQWKLVHERLGRRFPLDYLRFVSAYGHCMVDNELEVMNPFVPGRFWEEYGR